MSEQHGHDPLARGFARREFIKVGVVGGTSVVLSGVLAACGDSGSGSTPTAGSPAKGRPPSQPTGVLKIANPGEPASLDPTIGGDMVDWGLVHRKVYDPLVAFDPEYKELAPGLAESWESSDDAREWTFKLRSGVKFHDGEDFDASAYRAALEYYQNSKGPWKTNVPPIEETEVDDSDPTVFRVMFKNSAPDFDRNQAMLSVISPKLIAAGEEAVARTPTGTGPFKFVSYKRGSAVELEANADYWGDGPYLERLTYRILGDAAARSAALLAGDIDMILRADARQAKQLEGNSDLKVLSADSWAISVVVLMCDHEPMNDVRVRRACAHAIDKQSIVDNVLLGQAVVEHGTLPKGVYGYTQPATTYDYDPDRARQLLAEAGYPDGLDVQLAAPADIFVLGEETAEAVAGQLREVGVRAKVDVLEVSVFVDDLYGDKQPRRELYTGEFGMVNKGTFHWGGLIPSATRLNDDQLDEAATRVKQTANGPERLAAIQAAEDRLAELVPQLTLATLKVSSIVRNNVEGFVPPVDGYVPSLTSTYLLQ